MSFDFKRIVFTAAVIGMPFFSTVSAIAADNVFVVKQVEDGDTVVIDLNGKDERLQLAGIDAPENTQNAKLSLDIKNTGLPESSLIELGDRSKAHLELLIGEGNKVVVDGPLDNRDKYGRIMSLIKNEAGQSINVRMVEDGYAVLLKRYPLEEQLKQQLQQAEASAIRESRGLWSEYPDSTAAWSGRVKPD